MWQRRTPLAWQNLTHDRRRLLIAAGGIGFAVLLMCMQIGFYNAMLDSTSATLRQLDADLVILSKARYAMSFQETFPRERLAQAREVEAVDSVAPLYIELGISLWKCTQTGRDEPIRTFAFDPGDRAFLTPAIRLQQYKLDTPGHVLVDTKSKPEFHFPDPPTGVVSELAAKRAEVVGHFELGTDFANDGNLLMSTRSFVQYYDPTGGERLELVDLGLVHLKPGSSPSAARQELNEILPADVRVISLEELVDMERSFWQSTTPIGFVFWLGALMGFIVGVIICYQILYSDIDDHLREFATLKAIGYGRRFFILVVLEEALLLSLIGFVPGVIASLALYAWLAAATGLLMQLTLARAALLLLLTVVMCVVSGTLAMRRVLVVDPAELF